MEACSQFLEPRISLLMETVVFLTCRERSLSLIRSKRWMAMEFIYRSNAFIQ